MTNKDIEDFLLEFCGDTENIVMLDEDYAPAFIGVTSDGSAVYSYEKMITAFAENNNLPVDEAMEFIDYNAIHSIDYLPKDCHAPVIVYGRLEQD